MNINLKQRLTKAIVERDGLKKALSEFGTTLTRDHREAKNEIQKELSSVIAEIGEIQKQLSLV